MLAAVLPTTPTLCAQPPASEQARAVHARCLVFDGPVHAEDPAHVGLRGRPDRGNSGAIEIARTAPGIEGGFDLDGDPAAHNWTSYYADYCCSVPK
jgi:hypothetical protein